MPTFINKQTDHEIFYVTQGSGPPLFFLSGYLASHMGLLNLASFFKDSHTTVLMDNCGTGQSSHPDRPISIEEMASDTLALMAHLNFEKASFVGVSMGSGIVLTLALTKPQCIDKCILVTPFYRLPKPSLMAAQMALAAMEDGTSFEKAYASFAAWLYSDAFLSSPKLLEEKITLLKSLPPPTSAKGAKGQFHAIASYDVKEKLPSLNLPTLLLAGEQDILAPLYIAKEMHEKIKDSKLEVFKGGAHMIHHETPASVAQSIKNFL